MPITLNNSAAIAARAARTAFADAYSAFSQEVSPTIKAVMQLGLP